MTLCMKRFKFTGLLREMTDSRCEARKSEDMLTMSRPIECSKEVNAQSGVTEVQKPS